MFSPFGRLQTEEETDAFKGTLLRHILEWEGSTSE
jgi:hypothetical protein